MTTAQNFDYLNDSNLKEYAFRTGKMARVYVELGATKEYAHEYVHKTIRHLLVNTFDFSQNKSEKFTNWFLNQARSGYKQQPDYQFLTPQCAAYQGAISTLKAHGQVK